MDVLTDISRLLWLITLGALLLSIAAIVVGGRRRPSILTLVALLATTTLAVIVAVTLLSFVKLLNPVMLAAAVAGVPAGAWLLHHRRSLRADSLGAVRSVLIRSVAWYESPRPKATALGTMRTALDRYVGGLRRDGATSKFAAFIVIAVVTMTAPRLMDTLRNARLPGTAAYEELVVAQQHLAGDSGFARPRPFAATTAALAMISSISPVHIVRWLPPLIGVLTLLALMVLVRRTAGSTAGVTAVITVVLLSRERRPPTAEFADLFLLVALLLVHERLVARRDHTVAAIAAMAVAALAWPASVVVACAAVGSMLLWPGGTLILTGTVWLLLAHLDGPISAGAGAASPPLAAAFVIAGAIHAATARLGCERGARRAAMAAAALTALSVAIAPRSSAASYLEHDAAARQTLEIARQFPKFRFMIVAPVEQLALIYGQGWHMNLHEWVEAVDGDPGRLPDVDDVFVFVETRPFALFAREPQQVSFAVLADPVFRHYRSAAGRSSLQFAALKLCEQLRQEQSDVRIHYDDGRLRIYRLARR